MGFLLKIWTKPGASQQMESHESIESITGKGLSGCVGGKSKTRQVTVLSLKAWNEAQKTIGQQLDPINRRANFLVDEIDLENTKGMILLVGDLKIEITGETKPCVQMEKLHEGLREALKSHWRGGVTGKVLNSCCVNLGDQVKVIDPGQ